MALNELLRKRVELTFQNYCDTRIPNDLKDQVKISYEIRGNNVTLYEERPYFKDPSEWTKTIIAQFRYDSGLWAIYWKRHTGKWYRYEAESNRDLAVLLNIIDEDKLGLFWG